MMEVCTSRICDLLDNLAHQHGLGSNRLTDHVFRNLYRDFRKAVDEQGELYHPSKGSEDFEWSDSKTSENGAESDEMSSTSD